MLLLLLLLSQTLPNPAHADALAKKVDSALHALTKINQPQSELIECNDEKLSERPFCHELAQNFCAELWNSKNAGLMKVYDGQLNFGFSPDSNLSRVKIIDFRALIDSLPRLPSDFRELAEPAIQELKALLDKEESSDAWDRKIANAQRKVEEAIEDLANKRKHARFPEYYKKDITDRTVLEKLQVDAVDAEVFDEVLKAKYAEHPNWQRVEKVFAQARLDLAKEVKLLNVPAETKAFMLEQIRTVKLSLPFTDAAGLAKLRSCGTAETNANYTASEHTVTVCAGYFNGIASESSLYRVIAHEISHSFDPERFSRNNFYKNSLLQRKLTPLVKSWSGKIPCKEWNKIVSGALASKPPYVAAPALDKLYSCIQPRDQLTPWNDSAISATAERQAARNMSSESGKGGFANLMQPTYKKNDKNISNNQFMRPDLIIGKREGALPREGENHFLSALEIFSQNLQCATVTAKGREISFNADLPEPEKALLLKASAEKTKVFLKRYLH
jgi:hypothetical protein